MTLGDSMPFAWTQRRWQPVWGVVWLVVLTTFALPSALAPMHANRAGHRAAGEWLAGHVTGVDTIIDPFCWAHYYAGAVFREGQPPAAPPGHRPLYYAIWENSDNPHRRLPMIPHARKVKENGWPVYSWKPPRKWGFKRAEEVIVYACPLGQ
jgi:hypothetical protein